MQKRKGENNAILVKRLRGKRTREIKEFQERKKRTRYLSNLREGEKRKSRKGDDGEWGLKKKKPLRNPAVSRGLRRGPKLGKNLEKKQSQAFKGSQRKRLWKRAEEISRREREARVLHLR